MNRRNVPFVLIAVLASVLAAPATTLVRLSLQQLLQASTAIVRGRVVDSESRWNPQHTEIFTYTTVAVEQVMKGHPAAAVVVEQLGGAVGNYHVYVPGSARLLPQHSYFLFLEPASVNPSNFVVVGMKQGAYRIYRDPRTEQERVIRPFGGLFYGAGSVQQGGPQTLPVSEFRRALSSAASSPLLIPARTSIPVIIDETGFSGVGRMEVRARTTANLYPGSKAVIPAGSTVEGVAELESGMWKIAWSSVIVRGERVQIRASNEEPAGSLRGRVLMVKVR